MPLGLGHFAVSLLWLCCSKLGLVIFCTDMTQHMFMDLASQSWIGVVFLTLSVPGLESLFVKIA